MRNTVNTYMAKFVASKTRKSGAEIELGASLKRSAKMRLEMRARAFFAVEARPATSVMSFAASWDDWNSHLRSLLCGRLTLWQAPNMLAHFVADIAGGPAALPGGAAIPGGRAPSLHTDVRGPICHTSRTTASLSRATSARGGRGGDGSVRGTTKRIGQASGRTIDG